MLFENPADPMTRNELAVRHGNGSSLRLLGIEPTSLVNTWCIAKVIQYPESNDPQA